MNALFDFEDIYHVISPFAYKKRKFYLIHNILYALYSSTKIYTDDSLSRITNFYNVSKWDLADSFPDGKSINFVRDSLLRAESKVISSERLTLLASQHGMTFKQLNEIGCTIDDRIRPDLREKKWIQNLGS